MYYCLYNKMIIAIISLLFVSTLLMDVPPSVKNEMDKVISTNNKIIFNQTVCEMAKLSNTDLTNGITCNLSIPKIYCRQELSMVLQVEEKNLIYFLEQKSRAADWTLIETSNNSLLVINNLQEYTSYKFRLWGLANLTYGLGPSETEWIPTLESNKKPNVAMDLKVKEFILEDKFTAVINWNLSRDLSCYYEFEWCTSDSNYTETRKIKNPSDLFEIKIKNIAFESTYNIAVVTKSDNWLRESEKLWLIFNTTTCLDLYHELSFCEKSTINNEGTSLSSIHLYVFIFLVVILTIIILFISSNWEKKTRRLKISKPLEQMSLSEISKGKLDKKWEINLKNIKLLNVVGKGAFGVVHKGFLIQKTKYIDVAVKIINVSPIDKFTDFKNEIEIMKSISKHANIVSMIGWCQNKNDFYLVLEYCARGNLQTYLQSKKISNIYLKDVRKTKQIKFLIETLVIGKQVALGMEFLDKMQIVHCDLSSRNVLIAEDKTLKVSDFGLSRFANKDYICSKQTARKVPVRWLAIESLTHDCYTTKSDVWSFGVLLWEVVTLGSYPYPGVPTHKILQLITDGYRMERPVNCNKKIYNLMKHCWKAEPKDRPTFAVILKILDNMLQNKTAAYHLHIAQQLNADQNTLNMDSHSVQIHEK